MIVTGVPLFVEYGMPCMILKEEIISGPDGDMMGEPLIALGCLGYRPYANLLL